MTALTVLYIDDDPDTRFLFRELLEEGEGEQAVRLLEADGLQDALIHHRHHPADFVLVDNLLGGRQGVDLIPEIQAAWDCPIWVVSGLASPDLGQRCRTNGAAGLLSKDELLRDSRRLRSILLRSRAGSAEPRP